MYLSGVGHIARHHADPEAAISPLLVVKADSTDTHATPKVVYALQPLWCKTCF
jgi:hypothetical protein